MDDLDQKKIAFLNALNDGGALVEAAAYLDAGGEINAAIVPIVEQTLMHYAAVYQRIELIELLARRGADLDVRNAFGSTALHLAVTHEIDAIFLRPDDEPAFCCAIKLRELGASLDVVDKQGMTPRDLAGKYGSRMLDFFDEVMT